MRINNNITALNSHRQYGINTVNIAKNVEKLSYGFRVNRAADDAAGLAISEKMRAQIRGLNMASKNSQDAISLVQTAEGGLQTIQNVLQRMRELAVQAASDTNTFEDRMQLQREVNQLVQEIDDIAESTQFNTMTLLTGVYSKNPNGKGPLTIQAGANEGEDMQIIIGTMSALGLGVTGLSVSLAGATQTNNPGALLSQSTASKAITTIQIALNSVSNLRADLGAYQNRLEFKIANLDNQAENLAAAESRIRDTDMAKMMTEFTKNNILFQASTAMLAQANALPQAMLQLLG